ncbi:hypothetical protein D3C81_800270 [compost metagenome]
MEISIQIRSNSIFIHSDVRNIKMVESVLRGKEYCKLTDVSYNAGRQISLDPEDESEIQLANIYAHLNELASIESIVNDIQKSMGGEVSYSKDGTGMEFFTINF